MTDERLDQLNNMRRARDDLGRLIQRLQCSDHPVKVDAGPFSTTRIEGRLLDHFGVIVREEYDRLCKEYEEASSGEGVRVVRCAKCARYDPDQEYCSAWREGTEPDAFCSYGFCKEA